MENLEEVTLRRVAYKPISLFRYVYDTFVIWRYVLQKLDNVLNYFNGICPIAQFTMEAELDDHFPFMDS